MLFDCDGVVGPSLESVVVRNNHALGSANDTDSRDHISTRHTLLDTERIVARKLTNFEEGRSGIEDSIDSFSGQEFVSLLRNFSLPLPNIDRASHNLIQLPIQLHHFFVVLQVV